MDFFYLLLFALFLSAMMGLTWALGLLGDNS